MAIPCAWNRSLRHTPIEFALNRPPAGIGAFDLTDDRHPGRADFVTPQLEIAADHAIEHRVLSHFAFGVVSTRSTRPISWSRALRSANPAG